MNLSDFDYTYPEELIAQRPPPQREASRMMVVDRNSQSWQHTSVVHLPEYLKSGDLLVVNDSKVLPFRLFGKRKNGAGAELLLLKEIEKNVWSAISRHTSRMKIGETIEFENGISAEIIENRKEDLVIRFQTSQSVAEIVKKIGFPPLPPYIKRKNLEDYTEEDRERYQTVYAKHAGSAAAPTAGFHLSEKILEGLKRKGVEIVPVTLHVGLDTFSPVRTEKIEDHKMHGEDYFINESSRSAIERAKKEGQRIIAAGTTTVRALESFPTNHHTHLFITPGYKFKIVDGLLTNFHQPRSTLLVLVSAFAGREFILRAYQEAIQNRYRLFSYGDCMLII